MKHDTDDEDRGRALVMAALPAAAQSQSALFDFDPWFNGLSTMRVPEVEITIPWQPELLKEAEATDAVTANDILVRANISDGNPPATENLRIGISWTTAAGLTGDGSSSGLPAIIRAGQRSSAPVVVVVPDDNIAHSCNKLIVNLRSLQPDTCRIVPCVNGKGFVYVPCTDNDGGNPGGTLSGDCR